MSQAAPMMVPLSLAAALEKRARPTWSVDVTSFLMKGFEYPAGGGKIRMRIATVAEQDDALEGARQYVVSKTKDAARVDPDILGNAKVGYLMHRVCFQAERDVPCFPSGKWMLDTFTTDELSVLLNHYNDCLKIAGPIEFDLSDERLDGLAALLATHAATDVPNMYLAAFTREQIAEIAIRFAVRLRAAPAAAPAMDAATTASDVVDQDQSQ